MYFHAVETGTLDCKLGGACIPRDVLGDFCLCQRTGLDVLVVESNITARDHTSGHTFFLQYRRIHDAPTRPDLQEYIALLCMDGVNDLVGHE